MNLRITPPAGRRGQQPGRPNHDRHWQPSRGGQRSLPPRRLPGRKSR
jgi:hypothetical protein